MRTFVSLPFEKLDELFALIAQKEALYIPVDDASGKADFKRWKKGAVLYVSIGGFVSISLPAV